mgnify:CR=1 FL=1
MKSFQEYLVEVKIIGRGIPKKPLSDSDTIRVYHGAYDLGTVVQALKYGLTGDIRADRRYSYEANNNPRGLFVTPDLDVAKEFGPYIIEFHTRVGDLEAPVWPGGSFTVQGQISPTFSDEEEREAERIAQKERISKDAAKHIMQSDSPDVAFWLMDAGESQALFRGDLNRNSIRAVWVSTAPDRMRRPYRRMKPREFLKEYEKEGIPNKFGGRSKPSEVEQPKTDWYKLKKKLFAPRESASFEELYDRFSQWMIDRYGDRGRKIMKSQEDFLDLIRKNPSMVRDWVWSDRQYDQIMRDLDRM